MLGKKDHQMTFVLLSLEDMIPEKHLLKKINQLVNFQFIYELAAPYYSAKGRPSIDPVIMVKMLLVGFLYGIKSERRLMEEIQLNLAYRWFCGLDLADTVPNHSIFSQNRRRRFHDDAFFRSIFTEIVMKCIEFDLVTAEEIVVDGTYLPANVSKSSTMHVKQTVSKGMQSYLDALDQEFSEQPGFKKPEPEVKEVTVQVSTTDGDCRCINHRDKKGIGYLMETTVDCYCGIITGVDTFPANQKESLILLRHLEKQMVSLNLRYNKLALDKGYDSGCIHRGLELMGIEGYIAPVRYLNSPESHGFTYSKPNDCFICPEGHTLDYHILSCSKSTGKYLRCYQTQRTDCKNCPQKIKCIGEKAVRRRILASSCYPAFYAGHERTKHSEYSIMMKKRAIWAEGSFSVLKREHGLGHIKKRGLQRVSEECLLSATALNLKRMVKSILSLIYFRFYCTRETIVI